MIDLERYCLGCGSEIGYNPTNPNHCDVCWDRHRKISGELKKELQRYRELRMLSKKLVDSATNFIATGDDLDVLEAAIHEVKSHIRLP